MLTKIITKSLNRSTKTFSSISPSIINLHTHATSPIFSLKLTQPFTIKNYMKTYQLQNVQQTPAHIAHNIFRVDQFKQFSLDKDRIQEFIKQQNSNYEQSRKSWDHLTKKYHQLTSSRRDTRTTSTQQQYDDYSYYTSVKYIEERQYTIIHRRHNKTRKQELVLDIMQYYSLKKHSKTIELMRTSFSQSHRYLAFGYDLNNNEYVRWMVRDLKENRIVGVKGWEGNVLEGVNQVVFFKDRGVFYTKCENRRPAKLYYQEFDSEPELLWEEKDPAYWMYIELSKDKSQLIVSSSTKSQTKVKCLNLAASAALSAQSPTLSQSSIKFPSSQKSPLWTSIASQSTQQKLQVNHCSDYFIIWRERQSSNTISIKKDTSKEEVLIHALGAEESLVDMDVFQNRVVLYIQQNTKPVMRVINLNSDKEKVNGKLNESSSLVSIEQPSLPFELGKISPAMNQSYNSQSLLFYISTPFVYNEGYTYHFDTKQFTVKEKFEMTGPKFNEKKYEMKTIQVAALDGQQIPLTILCEKRNLQYPKKLMLKVYGFYGLANQVSYDNTNYALLENGWTIAHAHVRGGSEKGKQWHTQAIKNKSLTWSDLEDCVGYLLREKYTHPSLLFLQSHSAGAIAVWNMINKSPHLFKAVVMNYPFLDVLNTLLDPNDPLSSSDHAQFGNPLTSKKAFRQIESISPYQNIQEKPYPFIYIVGGQHDYRCPVEQLAKFVKKFRQLALTNNRFSQKIAQKGIMMKVHYDASHLGSSDISQENYNNCQIYGFLDHLVYEASNDCKY